MIKKLNNSELNINQKTFWILYEWNYFSYFYDSDNFSIIISLPYTKIN